MTTPVAPNTISKASGLALNAGAPLAPGTPEPQNEKHALLKKSLSSANACGVDLSKPSQNAKLSSGFLSNLLGRPRKTLSAVLPESPAVPPSPKAAVGANIHRASSSKSTIGPPPLSSEPFEWLAHPEHMSDDRTQLRVISQLRRLSEFNSRLSTASNTILRVSPVMRLAQDVTPVRADEELSTSSTAATAPVAAAVLKKDTLVQLVRCNSNSTQFAVRKFDPEKAANAAATDSSVDSHSHSRSASPKSVPESPSADALLWLSAADLGFREEDVSAFVNLQLSFQCAPLANATAASAGAGAGAADSPSALQAAQPPQKKGGLFARLKKSSIGKADKTSKPMCAPASPAPSPFTQRAATANHQDGGAATGVEDCASLSFEAPLYASAPFAARSTAVLTCKLAVAQPASVSVSVPVGSKSPSLGVSPAASGRTFVFWTGPQGLPVRAQLRSGLPHPSGGPTSPTAPAEISQHVAEDGFHSLQVRPQGRDRFSDA